MKITKLTWIGIILALLALGVVIGVKLGPILGHSNLDNDLGRRLAADIEVRSGFTTADAFDAYNLLNELAQGKTGLAMQDLSIKLDTYIINLNSSPENTSGTNTLVRKVLFQKVADIRRKYPDLDKETPQLIKDQVESILKNY